MALRAWTLLLPLLAAVPACLGEDTDASDPIDAQDEALNATKSLFINDVSILFPLPKASDVDKLLSPVASGDRGELLPQVTFDKLLRLVPEGAAREDLRLVAVRIDPCFPGGGVGEAACKNQIRLVFQPLDTTVANEKAKAKDAAVHVFYGMTRAEFATMAGEILAAKHGTRSTKRAALGPNPLLVQQGLSGTFATELKAVILKHAGAENLTRVTFMTREPARQPVWRFGGFDVNGEEHVPMKIASLGETTEQSFTTLIRNGRITPAVQHADNLTLLLNSFLSLNATPAEVKAAYEATLKIQNPDVHSPDTIDCVSCHTATSARIWAEKEAGQSATGNAAAFTSTWNVALTKSPSTERSDNLHAFSYLGENVAISQRTANESAVVADYINANVLTAR